MNAPATRPVAATAVFGAILLLSACQKAPDLMSIAPAGSPNRATAPAASDQHTPALQPYNPALPSRDGPSVRPRPGLPHPAIIEQAKSDAMSMPVDPSRQAGSTVPDNLRRRS